MFIFVLWLLILTTRAVIPTCRFERTPPSLFCESINLENLVYNFLDNDVITWNQISLTIASSKIVRIYSFPNVQPFHVGDITITDSLVEFIEDGAFEGIFPTSLDLSNNQLRDMSFVKTLPVSLEKLRLSGNNFENISNVFENLQHLSYLDLSNCSIRHIDPDSFSFFSKSLYLNLRKNKLFVFDPFFSDDLRLTIDISFNRIKSIDSRGRRIIFVSLNASHNEIQRIKDISCQDCESSYYRTSPSFIDLSFNDLKDFSFVNSFSGVKIDNLYLSNSNLDSHFNSEIIKHVKDGLDLSNNRLTSVTPKTFVDRINLNFLNLFNSSIVTIGERTFSSVNLRLLNLSSNLLIELRNFTFENSYINSLDISRCLIRDIEAKAFLGLKSILDLDLSHNQIKYLHEIVFQNLSLIHINLSFNRLKSLENNLFASCFQLRSLDLSNSGIKTLSKNLEFMMSEVNLRNNLISKIDFKFNLYHMLNLENNSIIDLDFSFLSNSTANTISFSKSGIRRICNSSISFTTTVFDLDISDSKIETIEVGAFQGFVSLGRLNLQNNRLSKISARTFFTLKKLVELNLAGNALKLFSKEAFSYNNALKTLNISFSDSIKSNTFMALNSLNELKISDSKSISLHESSFKGLYNLEIFNVDNVDIVDITRGAFNGLRKLKSANFEKLFKNIKTIKKGTFEGLLNLNILSLTDLSVSSIESNAFVGLPILQSLLLNNNLLTAIVNNTFVGLYSLKSLNLSCNKISTLEPNAFFGLYNLEEIYLMDNNLTRLYLGTFQHFPKLRVMVLQKNRINKLLTGTFSNLKSLDVLDLSYNNITRLKMQNLMPLSGLQRLDLTGNHLIQMSHLDLIKSLRYLQFVAINGNKWKCDNLASMLIAFQNYSIGWVSNKDASFDHENIDGIKCYDICKFFYCADEADVSWREK